ncbi:DUF3289 family protein [Kosakonia sp. H02]|nr:DUF3289 family protein [Kosakonia sp. H02]
MAALTFPRTIFKTQKRMDDYSATDMRYGDLSEYQLKNNFHLVDVSARVNPYALTKITPFNQPQSMFYGSRGEGDKITICECADILFDEFRHLSRAFSFYGPWQYTMQKMVAHMRNGNGMPFRDIFLDRALKEQIMKDNSPDNSTLLLLKDTFNRNINWLRKYYPAGRASELTQAILIGRLPKFDRFQDSFNGMGITVHDTWATDITIKSLHIDDERYRAVVHYKVQDHFGLDSADISNFKFHQFRFFRIWFMLQRYEQFGFKPFITNLETMIEITGDRNGH